MTMAFLSEQRTYTIKDALLNAASLQEVVDLFAAEIDALALADGYLVNLLDESNTHLSSRKIRYTPEFRYLEKTYLDYKILLDDGKLNARVMANGGIERVDGTTRDQTEANILLYWKICEMVGAAIRNPADPEARPVGVLILLGKERPISADQLEALQELLAIFYKSLANWLRFSHLESLHKTATAAIEEGKRLLQFLTEMNNLTSQEKIYEVFATELFRQLPFDIAGFSLVEGDRMVVQKVSVANPKFADICLEWENNLRQHPYPLDPTASGAVYALMSKTSLFFQDMQTFRHLPMTELDAKTFAILHTARSMFISPVRYKDNAIGVFALYSMEKPLTLSDADQQMLDHLSSFLGTALTNCKLYATSQEQNHKINELNERLQEHVNQLAEQASTDQLTGLFNFRSFEQALEKRLTDAGDPANRSALALAIIDIDHFKHFNDTYGHAAGNDILINVAREITRHVRQTDMACRYGGEEFVLILPKCDLDSALHLAERIRNGIESAVMNTCSGQRKVTVSIGCTVSQAGDTPELLFKRADQALYQAKRGGRNQVCRN